MIRIPFRLRPPPGRTLHSLLRDRKAFTIDRLLAIFYAILDEKVGLTCNLLAQISTLIHLKFLNFASGEGTIMDGSARLQCTVGMDFIVHIGKMVGFNVRQYLCDFF
ncbi:hypothetical protein quinque_014752 [Culex quinquefasciatus]